MKSAHNPTAVWSAGVLAGLLLCLVSGCASPSAQNRKIYDRYAELVAERNRALNAPVEASGAVEAPARPSAPPPASRPAEAAPRRPTEPVVKAAPAPVQVIAPRPVEKIEPKAVPAPQPVARPVPPAPAPAGPAASAKPAAAEVAPVPAPAAGSAYVASPSTDGVAYLLKVGDVVQVFLRGIPAADAIEDVIDEDGMISLPLINEIQAANMTASELERNIRKTYQEQDIYRNIAVNVVVPTRYYFIQGEIRGPGRFQIMSATRLSQAIAAAGGYTEYASGQVLVKRGGRIFKTVRNAKRLERTPEDDILLEPDDIIEVKRSLW